MSGAINTGGAILPRKRTRGEADPHNNEGDDSESDGSRLVTAYKDEEDTENLRMRSSNQKRLAMSGR